MKMKRQIWAMMIGVCAVICSLSLIIPSRNVEALAANADSTLQQSNPSITGGDDLQSTQSTEITTVELTVDIPKVGAESNAITFSVPDGASYDVRSEGEGKWKNAGGSVADRFIADYTYHAQFRVTPKEGYILSSNITITINGTEVSEHSITDNASFAFEFSCIPELTGTIEEIFLEGVPTATAGGAASPYSYSEPNGQYAVTGIWYRYNVDTSQYDVMNDGDQFENGNIYELLLRVDPADGYMLYPDCDIFVNGSMYKFETDAGEVRISASLASEVSMVQIQADAIPKAVIGETFQDSNIIPIPVNEESSVTVSGYWIYRDESGMEYRSGTFENGKVYYFQLEAVPKAGYSLSQGLEFRVGEESLWPDDYSTTMAKAKIRTSFAAVIHEIELLNLPTASLGDTLQTGYFQVDVPAGAAYTAEAWWTYYNTDANGWEPVDSATGTHVVQNGRRYLLNIQMIPANSYEFSDSVQTKAYGILHQSSVADPHWFMYEREFSFRQPITDVKITGLAVPEIGAIPSVAGLMVPADAHYTIASAQWRDADDHSLAAVFETGHAYTLEIEIAAKEGYEFQQETSVFINGEEMGFINNIIDTSILHIEKTFSFKETLEEIRLDNVPDMKVGERASTEVKIPEGAKYSADVFWSVWNDKTERTESFSGIFEAGKIYTLEIVVMPSAGYRFDADTTRFFIDGAEKEYAGISETDIFIYSKEFSSGLTPINKIELEVLAPVEGNHSTIRPVVTLPSGVNYRLSDDTEWVQGDLDKFWYINDYFVEDGSYGASIVLLANEGYMFGENPAILVNGTVPPAGAVMISQSQSSITFFFRYESAVEINEDFKDSDIPQELKAAQNGKFDTVSKIKEYLNTEIRELNNNLEGTVLYDVILMYSSDGGVTWHKADENHFPSDGKLKVSIRVPEGTNHADYQYTVLHMFSTSAFGKTPGDMEQSEVTERIGADGVQYLDFYVTGLSPIMVGWEKEKTDLKEPQQPEKFDVEIEINEDFKDSDIPQELKAAQNGKFDTVSKIKEYLNTEIRELNNNLEGTVLYDVILMYSSDGGVTWHKADENHFPSDGKLKVSIRVPEGTNHADYQYTVLHMFSTSAFGKTPGDMEQPEVTERIGADGVQYLDFYVTGLSPIMVGWEKEKTDLKEPQQPGNTDSVNPPEPDYNTSEPNHNTSEPNHNTSEPNNNIPETKDPEISVTAPLTGDALESQWGWSIISVIVAFTAVSVTLFKKKNIK